MSSHPNVPAWLQSRAGRWTVSAPGRVNLIGEHVDYCGGLVVPAAIGLRTWMTAEPRQDRLLCIETEEGLRAEFAADAVPSPGPEKWANYLRGVLAGFLTAGVRVPGLDVKIASTLPQGGGLASSAALTVAFATLLGRAADHALDGNRKAIICQEAEQQFAGVPSGCMDQMAAVHAREDHALLLDCRSLAIEHIPLASAALIVINTGVRHDLADGGYAARHRETHEAARLLGFPSLRDCTPERLTEKADCLPSVLFQRARHVVTEISRTDACAAALKSGDLALAGTLMNDSHVSLRDDFEVSCQELDLVADCAQALPGVFGCRMTGGGFGGCCVALVRPDAKAETEAALTEFCRAHLGPDSSVLVTHAAGGAE